MGFISALTAIAALGASVSAVAADSFAKPEVIHYGATAAQTEKALEGMCTKRVTRPINPPFLDNVKRQQLQIDCDGFPFMGKGRWAEFVIRDDKLEMVWMMVDADEQPAIVAAMEKTMGKPAITNGRYIAWPAQGAAWRFKPAEILFYGPGVADEAETWFVE